MKFCDFRNVIVMNIGASYLAQKMISEETLKNDCEENNRPIFAPKESKEE